MTLVLENLNFEPPDAEVHYMGHSIEELRMYFDAIASPAFKWGFSANHAHLLPGDFDSFVDAFGVDRIGLVLVADNRGQFEEHLLPGQGSLDFRRLFHRLEGDGYRGPYMLTFGTREEKLAGREYLLAQARGLVTARPIAAVLCGSAFELVGLQVGSGEPAGPAASRRGKLARSFPRRPRGVANSARGWPCRRRPALPLGG